MHSDTLFLSQLLSQVTGKGDPCILPDPSFPNSLIGWYERSFPPVSHPEKCQVTLLHSEKVSWATIYRIDDVHANAKALWQRVGKPEYLDSLAVKRLQTASEMRAQKIACKHEHGALSLSIKLPRHSVAAARIQSASARPVVKRTKRCDGLYQRLTTLPLAKAHDTCFVRFRRDPSPAALLILSRNGRNSKQRPSLPHRDQ
jgi:hypothetical protein